MQLDRSPRQTGEFFSISIGFQCPLSQVLFMSIIWMEMNFRNAPLIDIKSYRLKLNE